MYGAFVIEIGIGFGCMGVYGGFVSAGFAADGAPLTATANFCPAEQCEPTWQAKYS
jgi:hypothetical protein